MQSNWFASHVDLLLYIYGGLAIALVVWTLWRARKRKRAATQDDSPPSRSD
jgi:FtsZ-interacting cell division protein ZipA